MFSSTSWSQNGERLRLCSDRSRKNSNKRKKRRKKNERDYCLDSEKNDRDERTLRALWRMSAETKKELSLGSKTLRTGSANLNKHTESSRRSSNWLRGGNEHLRQKSRARKVNL